MDGKDIDSVEEKKEIRVREKARGKRQEERGVRKEDMDGKGIDSGKEKKEIGVREKAKGKGQKEGEKRRHGLER